MKTIKSTLLALALVATPALALDCDMPEAPTMPDGASSTMEDMLAGQKAVKAFQAANIDYMSCVENAMNAAEAAAKEARTRKAKVRYPRDRIKRRSDSPLASRGLL